MQHNFTSDNCNITDVFQLFKVLYNDFPKPFLWEELTLTEVAWKKQGGSS